MSYLGIILSFAFVNNIVFTELLGICPMFGVTRRLGSTVGLGLSVTVVAAISSLVAWVLERLVLAPLGLGFLEVIVVVLAAAGTAQGLDWLIERTSKRLYDSLGVFLPLVIANCAVVGIALLATRAQFGPLESLVAGASGGAGALMAMVLLSTLRSKMELEWVPAALRGTPITLISAGLVAMALLAFDKTLLARIVG